MTAAAQIAPLAHVRVLPDEPCTYAVKLSMGVERGRVRDVIYPPSTTLRAIVIVINDRGPRPDISSSPSASNDGMHLPRPRRMTFSSACEPQREREPSRFEGAPGSTRVRARA